MHPMRRAEIRGAPGDWEERSGGKRKTKFPYSFVFRGVKSCGNWKKGEKKRTYKRGISNRQERESMLVEWSLYGDLFGGGGERGE